MGEKAAKIRIRWCKIKISTNLRYFFKIILKSKQCSTFNMTSICKLYLHIIMFYVDLLHLDLYFFRHYITRWQLKCVVKFLLGPISSFKFDVGLYFYEQLYEILRTVMLSM